MAKKKSVLGTLVKLGIAAGAVAAVYMKREEIRAFAEEVIAAVESPEGPVEEEAENDCCAEPEMVIDQTAETPETDTQEG